MLKGRILFVCLSPTYCKRICDYYYTELYHLERPQVINEELLEPLGVVMATCHVILLDILACILMVMVVGQPPPGDLKLRHGNLTVPACPSHFCGNDSCATNVEGRDGCECDYACHFFGDCCIDRVNEDICSRTEDGVAFYNAVNHLERSQVRCLSLFHLALDYFFIASCPESWIDDDMREKCQAPSQSPFDVSSIPLSYDKFVTYKNIYCAICNGANLTTLTQWRTSLQCTDDAVGEFIQGNTSYRSLADSEECVQYTVEPPIGLTGPAVRRCRISDYNGYHCPLPSCPGLYDGCNTVIARIFDYNTSQLLKNIFCFYCFQQICLPSNFDDVLFYFDCTRKEFVTLPEVRGLQPISILFDFTSHDGGVRYVVESEVVEQITVTCSAEEVYDPFTETCLTLFCTDGHVLHNGQCLRIDFPESTTCESDNGLEISVRVSHAGDSPVSNDFTRAINVIRQCLEDNVLTWNRLELIPIESMAISHQSYTGFLGTDNTTFHFRVENSSESYFALVNRTRDFFEQEEERETLKMECSLNTLTILQGCIQSRGIQGCENDNGTIVESHVFSRVSSLGTSYIYINSTNTLYQPRESVMTTTFITSSNKTSSTAIVCHHADSTNSCKLATFNESLFEPFGEKGELYYIPTGSVINRGDYFPSVNGTIQVCRFLDRNGSVYRNSTRYFFKYSPVQIYLSYVCVSISMFALSVVFVTYCMFPVLRKVVSSKLLMVLCAVLFLAQLLLLTGGKATSIDSACAVVAVISHFLWLSVFTITTALAVDLARTFGSADKINFSTESSKILCIYLCGALGTSAITVIICIAIAYGTSFDIWYGDDTVCWIGNGVVNLIAFGGPVAVALLVNAIFFSCTIDGIRGSKKSVIKMNESPTSGGLGKELQIYIKISTLMGFTWAFGFVSAFAGIGFLWYIFIVLNGLQGVYIFLAFVVNRRVFNLWKDSWRVRKTVSSGARQETELRNRSKDTEVTDVQHSNMKKDEHEV